MKALYAGSFDPITNGHVDIILQAVELFDTLVIGIAVNPDKRYTLFSAQDRAYIVSKALKEYKLQSKIEIAEYTGMTVVYAEQVKAGILIRGLRAVSDFDGEFQMVQFNRRIHPGCNTMFLMPDEKHFYLSSTAIRGIVKMGGDISQFVPPCVVDAYAYNLEKGSIA